MTFVVIMTIAVTVLLVMWWWSTMWLSGVFHATTPRPQTVAYRPLDDQPSWVIGEAAAKLNTNDPDR